MIAEVKVNGKPVGHVWKFPYRLDITDAVNPAENQLEIQVTNLWPNRLIVAFTTWKWYSKDDPLLESGLLGPVRLRSALRRAILG